MLGIFYQATQHQAVVQDTRCLNQGGWPGAEDLSPDLARDPASGERDSPFRRSSGEGGSPRAWVLGAGESSRPIAELKVANASRNPLCGGGPSASPLQTQPAWEPRKRR